MHMLELLLLHSIILQIILQSGLGGRTGEERREQRWEKYYSPFLLLSNYISGSKGRHPEPDERAAALGGTFVLGKKCSIC